MPNGKTKAKECHLYILASLIIAYASFGPTKVRSLGGKIYAFVVMNDYSRFTLV